MDNAKGKLLKFKAPITATRKMTEDEVICLEYIEGGSTLSWPYLNYGQILHTEHDSPKNALYYYRKASEYSPEDPTPHYNIGCALDQMGKKYQAASAYMEAIELDPEYFEAHYNLALCLQDIAKRVDDDASEHAKYAQSLEKNQ